MWSQVLRLGDELRAWLAREPKEDVPVSSAPAKRHTSRLQVTAAVCLVASSILRPELVGVRIVKAASMAILLHSRKCD